MIVYFILAYIVLFMEIMCFTEIFFWVVSSLKISLGFFFFFKEIIVCCRIDFLVVLFEVSESNGYVYYQECTF